jgi:ribose transport system substrate-binding protein
MIGLHNSRPLSFQEVSMSERDEEHGPESTDAILEELMTPMTRRAALKRAAGLTAGVAMLTPAVAAYGATRSRTRASASKTLAFGHPHPSGAFYAVVEAGAKDTANKLGYELLQSRANGQLDRQVAEIQTWIAEPVTAMTILALDVKAMGPLRQKAKAAGIPWVSYAQVVPGSDGYDLFDDASAAKQVGLAAAAWIKKLGGPQNAKVAFMGDYTIQNVIIRLKGAEAALKRAIPNVNIVFRGKGLLAPEAFATTQTLLQQHPDLNVIICGADDGALGASKAYTDASKDISKVWIAGYDGSEPAMQQAISGTSPLRFVAALPLYTIGQMVVRIPDNVIHKRGITTFRAPYTMVSVYNKAAGTALINRFKKVGGG